MHIFYTNPAPCHNINRRKIPYSLHTKKHKLIRNPLRMLLRCGNHTKVNVVTDNKIRQFLYRSDRKSVV